MHNTARCSIGPPVGVGDVDLLDSASPQEKPAEASPRQIHENELLPIHFYILLIVFFTIDLNVISSGENLGTLDS